MHSKTMDPFMLMGKIIAMGLLMTFGTLYTCLHFRINREISCLITFSILAIYMVWAYILSDPPVQTLTRSDS